MQRIIYGCVSHIMRHRIGYAAGVFLTAAALTCGCMQGNACALTVQISLFGILRIALYETMLIVGLASAAVHPLGCLISVAVLAAKAFQNGLMFGWWCSTYPQRWMWLFPLALQSMAELSSVLSACCVSAYAALRIRRRNRSELYRYMLWIWMILMICALVRCLICAWAV